jgi:hypothetical protein
VARWDLFFLGGGGLLGLPTLVNDSERTNFLSNDAEKDYVR